MEARIRERAIASLPPEMHFVNENYGLYCSLCEIPQEFIKMPYSVLWVKRVYISNQDGKCRPLGTITLKDKGALQAVKSVIESICEVNFKGVNYTYWKGDCLNKHHKR